MTCLIGRAAEVERDARARHDMAGCDVAVRLARLLVPKEERTAEWVKHASAYIVGGCGADTVSLLTVQRLEPLGWYNDELINYNGAVATELTRRTPLPPLRLGPDGATRMPGTQRIGRLHFMTTWLLPKYAPEGSQPLRASTVPLRSSHAVATVAPSISVSNAIKSTEFRAAGAKRQRTTLSHSAHYSPVRHYSEVNRWFKDPDDGSLWSADYVRSLDILVIPAHTDSNHWSLVALDIRNKTLHYYDSLWHQAPPRVLAVLNLWAEIVKAKLSENEAVDIREWAVRNHNCPKQSNGSDCGVFTVEFMRAIAEGRPFNISPELATHHRTRLALEIEDSGVVRARQDARISADARDAKLEVPQRGAAATETPMAANAPANPVSNAA